MTFLCFLFFSLTLFLSELSTLSLHEGLLSASEAAAAALAEAAVADEAADDTEDVEPEDWPPAEATRVAVTEATVVVAVEPAKMDEKTKINFKIPFFSGNFRTVPIASCCSSLVLI